MNPRQHHGMGLGARTIASWVGLLLALAPAAFAQVRIESEAYSGTPFGVGRVTLHSGGEFRVNLNRTNAPRVGRIVDLARKMATQGENGPAIDLDSAEMALLEKSGRTFYPVFEKRDRPILRQFVSVPTEATILFLFQGDAPLDLTAYTPEVTTGQVAPRKDPNGYDRLLRAWWRDYSLAATQRDASRSYPPMVEEYLADTLSRRLRLAMPRVQEERGANVFQSELNLLLGTETARLAMTRKILLTETTLQPATEPLVEELPRPKVEVLDLPADVAVEPIAMHVPAECLYVRFGNFPNFLWLRHRLEEWGGELRDIVSERGLDYGLNDRMQHQLGLRESALAEFLGDRVIADVALIGTDTFLREGGSVGMLFQAKNSPALATDLQQQRLAAVNANKQATQEKLQIGGRDVSFFSAPDNSLRSFYVADGDFHLVTTSRKLVEWFLATGAGKHDSLGASDDFRRARSKMSLERGDSVFVYLSPAFFRNLLGAQYQIELDRRLRSAVEMELFPIAQLAARGEQKPYATIDDLVAGGFLPAGFGQRSDGSRLELVDGQPFDTLRGGRGSFAPVPDVVVDKVTRAESEQYRRFARDFTAQIGPIDPVMVAIHREPLPQQKLERVTIDLEAAPLSERHSRMLSQWLGEPTDQRLAPIPGDVVAFDAVLRGGTYFDNGEHHLFGALRDADPAISLDPRSGLIARMLTSQWDGLQGYLGAWPNPGYLRWLGGASGAPPDQAGYTRLITGLWRRQFDNFTLLSFHPEILDQTSRQLRFEKAERPAQLWFRADDLLNSKLAPMLNAFGYRQSRDMTRGNTRFLNMLSEQLHVPPAESLATAERLLGATLQSPLGGDYQLRDFRGDSKQWVSTALADRPNNEVPAEYQFPALNWLRGIQLEASAHDGLLAAHAEILMPAEARPGFQLPSLPFGPAKPAVGAPPPAAPKPADAKAAPNPKSRLKLPVLPAPTDNKLKGKREF